LWGKNAGGDGQQGAFKLRKPTRGLFGVGERGTTRKRGAKVAYQKCASASCNERGLTNWRIREHLGFRVFPQEQLKEREKKDALEGHNFRVPSPVVIGGEGRGGKKI